MSLLYLGTLRADFGLIFKNYMLDDEGMRGGRCKGFGIVKDANAGHVRYYIEDLRSSVSLLSLVPTTPAIQTRAGKKSLNLE